MRFEGQFKLTLTSSVLFNGCGCDCRDKVKVNLRHDRRVEVISAGADRRLDGMC